MVKIEIDDEEYNGLLITKDSLDRLKRLAILKLPISKHNEPIWNYLIMPYTVIIIPDNPVEDTGFFVRIEELPGCMSQGKTREDALDMINDAMLGWIEVELEDGESIPLPKGYKVG